MTPGEKVHTCWAKSEENRGQGTSRLFKYATEQPLRTGEDIQGLGQPWRACTAGRGLIGSLFQSRPLQPKRPQQARISPDSPLSGSQQPPGSQKRGLISTLYDRNNWSWTSHASSLAISLLRPPSMEPDDPGRNSLPGPTSVRYLKDSQGLSKTLLVPSSCGQNYCLTKRAWILNKDFKGPSHDSYIESYVQLIYGPSIHNIGCSSYR